MSLAAMDTIPGRVRRRSEVPRPCGYAVFDCETTGTSPVRDEIVSFALVRLDADGNEVGRCTSLVRPACPIPAEATAVHGISYRDVAAAPTLSEVARDLLRLLKGAVFVAHNAGFDLAMLQRGLAASGIDYEPPAVACTLEAFRLLEPLAPNHRLESICERRAIHLAKAHDSRSDAAATVALLRMLLDEDVAPETVRLDYQAFMRLRSRGDKRPATAPQIRRVFALGHAVGLSHEGILELVARVAGKTDVDALTREQVQHVYDALGPAAGERIERAA
jgi:DNA polymerase III subunit epsilon